MPTHDIYIYPEAKGKSSGIRIPWLPEEIQVDKGKLRALEYDILDQGPVDIPNGSNLGEISFSSIFPGEARSNLPFLRGSFRAPEEYQKQLDSWKENGTKLKLIITGTSVNCPVYCSQFVYRFSGGYGDISYQLTLKTRREVEITTIKPSSGSKNKPKSDTKSDGGSYTIKKGDTLWAIAGKKLGKGSRWKEIYTLNKDIINKTAQKHGKKDSDGGHWIYPGTVIRIPKK